MKRLLAFILLVFVSASLFAANNLTNKKLKLEINKNVELLGLAYFVAFEGVDIEKKTILKDGKEIPKKDWHNYGYYIYNQYKAFAPSKNLGKSFTVADHLWLDYLINLLLQVDDFPNAKLKESIDESYYLNFSKKKDIIEARQNATIFLEGLNEFYKEINFHEYLKATKPFYDKALSEIKNELPEKNFIHTLESFYKTKFNSYVLVPSLTIPKGMGFGLQHTTTNKTHVFNVFGAFDYQNFTDKEKLEMGFANESRLRELSVHEFGHSFVNPIIDKLPPDIFSNTNILFEPIKSSMLNQGYNNWKTCIYEHFVRAGEIIIANKLGNKEAANQLQTEYGQTRKFIYIPTILAELEKYDNGKTKTYQEAVLRAMSELSRK